MWDTLEIILCILLVVVFFPLLVILYFVSGILDLTYHERHKPDKNSQSCPYFIDKDE